MSVSPALVAKISSMFILGGVSLFLGVLPIKLSSKFNFTASEHKSGKVEKFISAMSCFGAGVILTTCITHVLPEVNMFLKHNIEQGHMPDYGLAMAEIFFLSGFVMVYFVEELVHVVVGHCFMDKLVNAKIKESKSQANLQLSGSNIIEHDHESQAIAAVQASLRGFLVILALSMHAIFEGIAVGLTQHASFVWYLCFAVAAHKYVISFCIGMQFVSSGHLSNWVIFLYQATFSFITPIGIGIGIALTETPSVQGEEDLQTPTITVLQGLAAGTLLYVVFFEVLEKERMKKHSNGLFQVSFFILGVLVMILVQLFESHETSGKPQLFSTCRMEQALSSTVYPFNVTCENGTITEVKNSDELLN